MTTNGERMRKASLNLFGRFAVKLAEAIAHYTTAIQASCLTPGDEAANEESKRELSSALSALFSNRCAARLQLDQGLEALSDARHCVELTPTWPKGHFREGCCLRQLNQLEDAQLAFATGQKLEPENKDWGKEMERTEKLLLAQPAYQAQTRRYPQV